jgi:hypothetical protein
MNTQNIHTSDLSFAREKVDKDLNQNKNRRLSALFRDIRKWDSVLGIGDWPIMSMIVQEVSRFKKVGDFEVHTLCSQSKEYKAMKKKEKTRFIKTWQSVECRLGLNCVNRNDVKMNATLNNYNLTDKKKGERK